MHGLEVLIAINKNPKLLKRGLDCTINLPTPKDLRGKEPMNDRWKASLQKAEPAPRPQEKPKGPGERESNAA